MGEREETTGLQNLAAELTRRGWGAHLRRLRRGPCLEVTNPQTGSADEPPLAELVTCQAAPDDGGLAYALPGGQVIGSVSDVEAAAENIQHVLRSVGS